MKYSFFWTDRSRKDLEKNEEDLLRLNFFLPF